MAEFSESIAAFAPAFVELQSKLPTLERTAESHHGKYVPLAGMLEAVKDLLHEEGFAVAQACTGGDGGHVSVTTVLLHKSGEWMRATLSMPTGGNGAQGVGSAITYGRRYALGAILSLATETDDDGHAASQQRPPARQTRPPANRAEAESRAKPKAEEKTEASNLPGAASQPQINLIAIECKKQGIDEANRVEHVSNLAGRPLKSTKELTHEEASTVIDKLKRGAA